MNRMRCLCVLAMGFAACADDAPTEIARARILVTGEYSLSIGETLQLAVETQDGEDSGYTYTSSEPDLFTVSETGLVTGVAAGEGQVVVTGIDTDESAVHGIVVLATPVDTAPDAEVQRIEDDWLRSAHADANSEAFTHFDEEGEIPTTCARCHSRDGFIDYLGDDGSPALSVDQPASTDTTVDCETCHTPSASQLTSVEFPSGDVVTGLGAEARCMVCHQGRASTDSVNDAITEAGVTSDDEVSTELSVPSNHYYPAGATLYAGQVRGAYQYDNESYDVRFRHVDGFNSCVGCHDAHTLQVKYDECVSCHPGATDRNGAHEIRMIASRGQDYDGDGNTDEGIFFEVQTLRDTLLAAIQTYANGNGTSICNVPNQYPYWFIDTNGDGSCGDDEVSFPNRYASWTARLLRGAYNYQTVISEPGAFAHNAKYIIEVLVDSLNDVNEGIVITEKLDLSGLTRNDGKHFNGSSLAARRWDSDTQVTSACSRCHSGEAGYSFFVQFQVGLDVPETSNGLECSTCHSSFGNEFAVREDVTETYFPGGEVLANDTEENLCSNCHTGRTGRADIEAQIASGNPQFLNVHYAAAAASTNGTNAQVGAEYDSRSYTGRLEHQGGVECTSCHDPVQSNHTFAIEDVWESRCQNCHADEDSAAEVRDDDRIDDYDGDPGTTQLVDELATFASTLGTALSQYTSSRPEDSGQPRMCVGNGYPYFFLDTDSSGFICSPGEDIFPNAFNRWDGPSLRAMHNYNFWLHEPGGYAHNFDYMGQLLYDSIENLGESQPVPDTSLLDGLVRPEVTP